MTNLDSKSKRHNSSVFVDVSTCSFIFSTIFMLFIDIFTKNKVTKIHVQLSLENHVASGQPAGRYS